MSRTARTALLGATMAALLAASVSSAQGLDSGSRQNAVAKLADALRERYVFPEVGSKAADIVTAKLKAGAYDSLGDPVQFTAQLTTDVNTVAHDLHFRVSAPGSPPPAGLPPTPRNEAGVVRAHKFANEIGYIEVAGFPPLDQFKPVIDRAMSSLAGSKALIADDRRNTGGDPASVAYLVSFLVPPGRTSTTSSCEHPRPLASRGRSFARKQRRSALPGIQFLS